MTSQNAPAKKPNIVLILIDDMGWRDVGCYGSSFYETPNLDKLALTGMLFSNAYAACPVCSPTRASILTGKYPATLGLTRHIGPVVGRGKLIEAPYVDHLALEETSIASALREGGYRTWHVGKWHLGGQAYYPEKHGFDVNVAGCDWGQPKKGYFSPYSMENLEDGPAGEYLTDRLTDEAIRLIRQPDERPFFLYLAHYAVHTPIQGRPEWKAKYEAKAAAMGLDPAQAIEPGEFHPTEGKRDQRIMRRRVQSHPVYAGMVENLDHNIGRLLQALDETDQSDTIVIFTSDNGGLSTSEGSPTSNAPLNEGKGWMYEGGLREPLIVRWRGVVETGSVCDTPVTSPDFYPTLLEMAGLPLRSEQHTDGVSLLPLLRGKGTGTLEREAIYWHFPHYGNQGGTPGSSVRMGDYKLIEFFEDGRLELYDLSRDIGEEHNLAAQETELAARMQLMLAEWRRSVEAKYPEPNREFAGG
jgi:arylsulfatase A-like enzyme